MVVENNKNYQNFLEKELTVPNPNDYDHQSKLVRLAMGDVRTGLFITREALYKLVSLEVKE